MKKIRGDKPSGLIIHTDMEISQGNSLCSYLYLKLKCHVFYIIFSLFYSRILEKKRAEQALPSRERWNLWEGGSVGETR
jgi:hypothetical protein